MKKMFLSFIAICAMFFGIMSAEASWYPECTSYSVGDEIEVVLGDGKKEKFYVIENREADCYVTAIYKGVLGETISFGLVQNGTTFGNSNAEKKLNELTKNWVTPDTIRLIKSSEITDDIDTSKESAYEFSKPAYLNIGKSYWTETVINSNDTFKPYVVSGSVNHSTLKTTVDDTAYIRPVIEVFKLNIDGGAVKPKNWDEFIKFYSDMIFEEGYESKIESTEKSLYIKMTKGDIVSEANFEFIDGLLIYKNEQSNGINVVSEFMLRLVASLNHSRLVYDVYDDYDLDTFDGAYTFNEDYISVIRNETSEVNEKYIKEMTVDLATFLGWKTEEEIKIDDTKTEETKKEEIKEEVKNPKTADTNIVLITLGLIASGSLIVISKKKLCKNK